MECKYFKICEHVQKDGYTCNHELEACDYCGIHRDVDNGILERLKK